MIYRKNLTLVLMVRDNVGLQLPQTTAFLRPGRAVAGLDFSSGFVDCALFHFFGTGRKVKEKCMQHGALLCLRCLIAQSEDRRARRPYRRRVLPVVDGIIPTQY